MDSNYFCLKKKNSPPNPQRCYFPLQANLRGKFPAQGSASCTPGLCSGALGIALPLKSNFPFAFSLHPKGDGVCRLQAMTLRSVHGGVAQCAWVRPLSGRCV